MAEVMQVMAFDCDLNHAVETQPLPNVLVKGDKDAHEVRITVMRGDAPVSIEGATVTGTGIMGMNVAVATGKAAGNVASFVLNEGFYAQHGEITLLLTVMLDGVETTVFRGVGNVLPSGSGKTVIDPGDVLGWGELQNAAKEAARAAANANAAAGEANAAATNANDKANAAETATASVNAAKDKAETAAVNANREAAAAKTATQNADSAASKATLAAGDAEEQTAAANKATTAATQAAQSAQGVVQEADAAIGELNAVVDDVQHKLDTGAFVGAQGEKGERGEQGIQGVPGKDGAPGIPGKDGAPGKDAPQIDDSTMTATNPWSSLHTVDMLCPPIDATGNPVVCYPVAGYPLGVKASWVPKQEGAGEPSPENIRPIVGRDAVKVARQEDSAQVDVQIPHTIYGGEVDAVTGQGTETWGHATISRVQSATVMDTVVRGVASLTARAVTAKTGSAISSYLPEKVHFVDDAPGFYTNQNSAYIKIAKSLLPSPDMDGLNAYLTAQPLDVAYKLATPVPFTATGGAPLPALAGTNTVLTDGDTVQVTGRGDIGHALAALAGRSAALENAIIKP